jgi:hypothetical protein
MDLVAKVSPFLLGIGFVAGAMFVAIMLFRNWSATRRRATILRNRNQLDDEQFAHQFFRSPDRADIAVRARRVLSKNLTTSLLGLMPNDRLNEDLDASLPLNPHLFWELETEFKINTDVDDLESHEKTLQTLVTFGDLVNYIERKLTEPRVQACVPGPAEKTAPVLAFAFSSIRFLFLAGFVTVSVGTVLDRTVVVKLGACIFCLAVIVWAIANSAGILGSVCQSARGSTAAEIRAHPWSFILSIVFSLFLLFVGTSLAWAVISGLQSH